MCCPNCTAAADQHTSITVNDAIEPDKVVAAIRRYMKRNGVDARA